MKANGNKSVRDLEGSTISRSVDRDDFGSLCESHRRISIQLYDFAETMLMAIAIARHRHRSYRRYSQDAFFFRVAAMVVGMINLIESVSRG